jgi:hypothetical protein
MRAAKIRRKKDWSALELIGDYLAEPLAEAPASLSLKMERSAVPAPLALFVPGPAEGRIRSDPRQPEVRPTRLPNARPAIWPMRER